MITTFYLNCFVSLVALGHPWPPRHLYILYIARLRRGYFFCRRDAALYSAVPSAHQGSIFFTRLKKIDEKKGRPRLVRWPLSAGRFARPCAHATLALPVRRPWPPRHLYILYVALRRVHFLYSSKENGRKERTPQGSSASADTLGARLQRAST